MRKEADMRISVLSAAALCLAAVPVFAQSPRDVTGPYKLTPEIVTCTDLPILTKPIPRLIVKGAQSPDDRFAMTPGQQIVIGRSPDDGLAVGQRYTASRLNRDEKYFPRPGEGYGGLRVTGFVTIYAVNQWNALADVDFACDAIQPGDYLEPFALSDLPGGAAANLYPDFNDRGSILFGADNRILVGEGQVVSIDRGAVHGVTVGARFAVYRDKQKSFISQPVVPSRGATPRSPRNAHTGEDVMPLVYIGDVVVMSVSETTSKVIVTRMTDGIINGDTVVPRRLTTPQQATVTN
jgi:hypothetical protein